jgi:hypothetical protein
MQQKIIEEIPTWVQLLLLPPTVKGDPPPEPAIWDRKA